MPATVGVDFGSYDQSFFLADEVRAAVKVAFDAWTRRFDYTTGNYSVTFSFTKYNPTPPYGSILKGDTFVQVGAFGGTPVVMPLFGLNVVGRNGAAPNTPTLQLVVSQFADYNLFDGVSTTDLEREFEHALGVRSSRGTAPAVPAPSGATTVFDFNVAGIENPATTRPVGLPLFTNGPNAVVAFQAAGGRGPLALSSHDASVLASLPQNGGIAVNTSYIPSQQVTDLDAALLRDAGMPALSNQEIVEHQIARLYFADYGRVATGTELTGSTRYYNAAIAAGQAPAAILATIGAALVSDPAQASNLASLSPADFVKTAYQNTFGRDPDAQTASAIAQYVAGAGTAGRGAVLAALTDTDEARGRLSANPNVTYAGTVEAQTARLYDTAFGRTADSGGYAQYTRALISSFTLKQAAMSFLQSGEFAARYGASPSDQALVDGLYQNTLGRAPDTAGEAQYLRALASGAFDRADLVVAFSESGEHIALMAQRVGAQDAAGLYVNTQTPLGLLPVLSGTSVYPGAAVSG